jgi:iron complex transport system substrate-binding protein
MRRTPRITSTPKTPRTLAAALAALALAVGLAGCGGSAPPTSNATATGTAADTFPVTVGPLTLTERPDRIVVLTPSLTETVFAVDAGPQVVAVDELSNYPANAPRTDLSGFKPNAEAIAKYQPDLVLLANDMDNVVSQLRTLNIPTLLLPYAKTLDEAYQQIVDVGTLTGHSAAAQALVERMKADIDKLIAELPRRDRNLTYYYELDATSFYSVTSNTFVGSLFTKASLVNIADPAGKDGNDFPQLSAEYIVKANPDLIFLANTKCCGQSYDTVSKRPGWAEISAVRNRQVIALDDDIASRWGPRLVDLLRAITKAVAEAPVG